MTPPDTLVLTARDVAALLELPACIARVERALTLHDAGRTVGPTSLGIAMPDGSFHVKAAGLSDEGRTVIVAKANANVPSNPARRGLPTIQGALLLFDADSGVPLAVMDSSVITTVRTGAVGAIAVKHLARRGADTVTIIGCGTQGAIQLRAAATVRTMRQAWAIDADPEKARAFAARMSAELGIPVESGGEPKDAIARSDICVTCTTSSEPVVSESDVHPGLLIVAIGADNPGKQELEPAVLGRARLVVDSLEACAAGGELHHALDAAVLTRAEVDAELAAVVSGRHPGRRTEADAIVFDSTGTAIQDVAPAVLVYDRACASGRGVRVALGSP